MHSLIAETGQRHVGLRRADNHAGGTVRPDQSCEGRNPRSAGSAEDSRTPGGADLPRDSRDWYAGQRQATCRRMSRRGGRPMDDSPPGRRCGELTNSRWPGSIRRGEKPQGRGGACENKRNRPHTDCPLLRGTSKRDRSDGGTSESAQRRRQTLKGPKPHERRPSWPVRQQIRRASTSGPTIRSDRPRRRAGR